MAPVAARVLSCGSACSCSISSWPSATPWRYRWSWYAVSSTAGGGGGSEPYWRKGGEAAVVTRRVPRPGARGSWRRINPAPAADEPGPGDDGGDGGEDGRCRSVVVLVVSQACHMLASPSSSSRAANLARSLYS